MSLWAIRILFLSMITMAGYAVSQQPDLTFFQDLPFSPGVLGSMTGFGFGGLLIALDEMLKGFSLRAFSAMTFGLMLGYFVAWLIDGSKLFIWVDQPSTLWLVRMSLFLSFSYIGMVLAMRSNKEDFYLIIPFVRLAPQNQPAHLLLLDTSAIIDGRVADLIEANFLEGIIVVPRFVLKELQHIADSHDAIKRARGRRGLDVLSRIQSVPKNEVKIHEGDIPEESEVDSKLVILARALNAKLITCDHNLGKIAELQAVRHLNVAEVASTLRPTILPGEQFTVRIVREGKDKGQGVAFFPDGTMVVVNNGQSLIGKQVEIVVTNLLHTGAGVIVFADSKDKHPPGTSA